MLAIHKPQRDTPPNGIPRFLKARCDALLRNRRRCQGISPSRHLLHLF